MYKTFLIIMLLVSFNLPARAEEMVYSNNPLPTGIVATLTSLAHAAGKDIVINCKLDGAVLVNVSNVSIYDALNYLARTNNINYVVDGNVILVTTSDLMTQLKTFPIKYINPEYAKKQLSASIAESKIIVNPETSTLTVDGTSAQLKKIEQALKEMDRPVKMVRIKLQMIEINRSDEDKLGLSYTWPQYTGNTSWKPQWTATLDADKIRNSGKTLAQPTIEVLSGWPAKVLMGDKVPVPTNTSSGTTTATSVTYQDVGVNFEVTPQVREDNTISLALHPQVSSISKWVNVGNGVNAPQISNREANTNVHVKSASTIVIGGLVQEQDLKNLNGIPGLSSLPILGSLFRTTDNTKNKTDVFILVTPTIVEDEEESNPTIPTEHGITPPLPDPVTPPVVPPVTPPATPPATITPILPENPTNAVSNSNLEISKI